MPHRQCRIDISPGFTNPALMILRAVDFAAAVLDSLSEDPVDAFDSVGHAL